MRTPVTGFWCAFMNERYKHGIETSPTQHWNIDFLFHANQMDGTSYGIYVIQFVENYLVGKSLKLTWTKRAVDEKRYYIGSALAAFRSIQIGTIGICKQVEEIVEPWSGTF